MRKTGSLHFILAVILMAGIYSCDKNESFDPQGGQLPTNYININDSSFAPSLLTVANGSSFTFLNNTTTSHTLVSDDSTTILSPSITGGSFYFVRPDTLAGSQPIYIYYHCREHPSVTGLIVLRP